MHGGGVGGTGGTIFRLVVPGINMYGKLSHYYSTTLHTLYSTILR